MAVTYMTFLAEGGGAEEELIDHCKKPLWYDCIYMKCPE
jgi:hypothetical protein